MMFASDNAGPVHPAILSALAEAGAQDALPYGNDPFSDRAVAAVRALFESPEASVHFVPTGTAANSLALAALARPWDAIYCHPMAHIEVDEAGGPEFFIGGGKLRLVDGDDGKMTPDALRAAIAATPEGDVHSVQRGPVSLTQITEVGTLYDLDEIAALTAVARGFGLKTHLDGARFANACAALDCTPAEMTWKAGVDAVSFGGTKNGCLGVEAVVLFDPAPHRATSMRQKRAGHLWSRHRFLGAQMAAYLDGGLWLDLARAANARTAELARGLVDVPGARILHRPAGNLLFADLPRAAHARAMAAGARYFLYPGDVSVSDGPADEPVRCRLVCDWSRTASDVHRLLELWRG